MNELMAVLPSSLLHILFTVLLLVSAGLITRKIEPGLPIRWKVLVTFGVALSLTLTANTWLGFHQLRILAAAGQRNEADKAALSSQADASKQAAPAKAVDPALQLKAEFLQTVEQLVNSPAQITADLKAKLFARFAGLFPEGASDKAKFEKSITEVYQCQRALLEDAIQSYKTKKAVKSAERERCEAASGEFYHRQKLVPPEQQAGNEKLITALAAHETIPNPLQEGTNVDVKSLRNALATQARRVEGIKKLFE